MVDAQTAAVASGDIHIGSGTTDTAKGSVVKVKIPSLTERATVLFIGGAGDKKSYYFNGPFHNIVPAREHLDGREEDLKERKLYRSEYLGYYEIHSDSDIKKNVLPLIPSKTAPVYIVGHSLGGWNGAHLSRALVDAGYNVVVLVTLDPVGGGKLVEIGSSISFSPQEEPKAKVWINVRATPVQTDITDHIATFGERWVIKSGPNVNVDAKVHHGDSRDLFTTKLANGMTVADILHSSIRSWTCGATRDASH
jgi:pimeloyl-ACP methyl ester carboxylesterase